MLGRAELILLIQGCKTLWLIMSYVFESFILIDIYGILH